MPMKFRPCIDIHNGQVKQIVGGTLQDEGNSAVENFASLNDAEYFAALYQQQGLKGGHVIMLNAGNSDFYPATKQQAISALRTYPGGLQIGGGITDENAAEFLEAGASHVIVTSFIFQNGQIRYDNLKKLVQAIGREKIVIDVSCRKRDGEYYVVTDRWQHFSEVRMSERLLTELAGYCDEFLIHAVDVEGRQAGIDEQVVSILAGYCRGDKKNATLRRVTYAGGISTYEDIDRLNALGEGYIDATIGSALDLFGGHLKFDTVVEHFNKV
jgi:phosphoribosylformimino-5-aminoimidazole carboxamide ribotide isomerase